MAHTALTLWQVRAVCTQREPTGRVIIVIVAENEEKEDKREESRERERRKRTTEERKKKGRERRRGRERGPPCVGSKRLRVYWQNARQTRTHSCAHVLMDCISHMEMDTENTMYDVPALTMPSGVTLRYSSSRKKSPIHTPPSNMSLTMSLTLEPCVGASLKGV